MTDYEKGFEAGLKSMWKKCIVFILKLNALILKDLVMFAVLNLALLLKSVGKTIQGRRKNDYRKNDV